MKYRSGDEIFTSKKVAIARRDMLNASIKKAGDINLVNRVLRNNGKWTLRASSKRRVL